MTILDVAVIGGGQAGLAIGYHLRKLGLNFRIIDACTSVGHVWRSRWDSLRLFTPAQYAGLPGLPFPAKRDSYPTKDQVADYLDTYATEFALPIQLGTHVTALHRDRNHFRLTTPTGDVRARQVVIATGPFQTPAMPLTAEGLATDVFQVHSSRYRNPQQLPEGDVLVVGGGNSGFQIAAELAQHRRVTLSVGTRNVTIPQRPLGRDIFWWQTITGLVTAPADSRRGRWMRRGEGTVIGSSIRELRRAGVTMRSRLAAADGPRVRFSDGHAMPVSTLVWATGFRRDHIWIEVPGVLDEHGQLRHRGGVTPAAGLYVLGQPWQRTSGSALIGYVGHDAAHLARLIR
jgi:putative flavoprotein involved in K+ transport